MLNYNGGEHVLTCIEHLCRTEWPEDAFEVVVVDNASTDGSDERIAEQFPQVRLVRSPTNDGFPANNLAMRELDDVDHVALINNDAFVEPDWLAPLVAALDAEPDLGAACPRILFAPGFLDVELSASTFLPGGADPRTLGVQVRGVEVDGKDAWRGAQFATGFWGLEVGPGPDEHFQWTADEAVLRVPVQPRRPAEAQLTLRLGGPPGTAVALRCGDERAEAILGDAGATVELALRGEPHDVVNNVGSVLVEGGYGADRGFLAPDAGQFADPAEVFSWCGAGVLLRGHYLRHVGLFDERFFMYYEDTDLSWRGRARGWRYRYVPDSTLRHVHAATSVEGSALFTHFVERNRLLMLAKNAPASMAAWAAVHHLLVTASYVRRDVVRPVLGKHRPNTELSERRLRAFAGAVRLAPAILADRRAGRSRQTVADEELLAWLVPQP